MDKCEKEAGIQKGMTYKKYQVSSHVLALNLVKRVYLPFCYYSNKT
jgi:hypothetical protein